MEVHEKSLMERPQRVVGNFSTAAQVEFEHGGSSFSDGSRSREDPGQLVATSLLFEVDLCQFLDFAGWDPHIGLASTHFLRKGLCALWRGPVCCDAEGW